MTEAILINRTELDKNISKEYLSLIWKQQGGIMRVLLFGISFFAVGYAIYQLIVIGGQAAIYAGSMIALGLFAFAVAQFGYLLRVKKHSKAQQELWKAQSLSKDIQFFSDKIVQRTRLGEFTGEYSKVTKYAEGKTLALIMFGDATMVLKKDGFTKGSLQEMHTLLAKKCPALPRKRKA